MRPLLEMKHITKIYDSGVCANDDVSFSLEEGEIHAIAGENGAGKSTLMKILCGAEKPSSGEILLRGQKVSLHSPRDAQAAGIGMVWQHFMLVNEFPVYRNIYLGSEPKNRFGFLRDRQMIAEARELAKKYNMSVDVLAKCGELTVGQAQKVEILKVLSKGTKILILDEPTAVLTPQETDELFHQLLLLKEDGYSVVIITHKLNEIKRICDRVTVLRAGKSVGVYRVADVTEEEISSLMVGSAVSLQTEKTPSSPEGVAAEVGEAEQRREGDAAHPAHQRALLRLEAVGEYALVPREVQLLVAVGVVCLLEYRDVIDAAPVQVGVFVGVHRVDLDADGLEIAARELAGVADVLDAARAAALARQYENLFEPRFGDRLKLSLDFLHVELRAADFVVAVEAAVDAVIFAVV